MSVFKTLHAALSGIVDTLVRDGSLSLEGAPAPFVMEPPRDEQHGDMATNVAMVLAKAAKKPPRVLAEMILPHLAALPEVAEASIAGPGFINLRLKPNVWLAEVAHMLREGVSYGDSALGDGERINVEFVSANPTGPMHAGHVRGAVLGDALSALLSKAGYAVTREYYFNDAGAQVDTLARTVHLRYREALGESIGAIPEGLYPGEYLKDVGEALAAEVGAQWRTAPEADWLAPVRDFAVKAIMALIREDLELIGIRHDVFTNERELIESGLLDTVYKDLDARGLIYVGTLPPPKGKVADDWEPAPLVLFRASQFGDSSDRPLKKRDGSWTYAMPDIAYHYDKVQRGFTGLINVWGKDHGAYADRIRPVVQVFSGGRVRLDIAFVSIVKVLKNGEPVKLSKRSGNIITLREMVEQVGAGAVRFFMLTRMPDSELEFDFAKVVEQTRDNPVFYVQYAHARCCSVLRHAAEMMTPAALMPEALAEADLSPLAAPDTLSLIRALAGWPRAVEAAALAREPHRIAFFLMDIAARFHALWNKGHDDASLRFIVPDDPVLTCARLAMVQAVRTVIASGLAVMGCTPVEEMRHDDTIAAA